MSGHNRIKNSHKDAKF